MTAPVVPRLIVNDLLNNKDDYKDWCFRVETYLRAEGLWNVVDDEREPCNGKDKREAWNKINAKALHAIHICCGNDAFSVIRGKNSARNAWKALANFFGNRDKKKTDQGDNITTPSSDSSDTESETHEDTEVKSEPGNEAAEAGEVKTSDNEYLSDLEDAIQVWETKTILEIIRKNPAAVRVVCPRNGMTALHEAVCKHDLDVVKELLELMTEEDLEIMDKDGCTPLHCCCLTQKGDSPTLVEIAKCLVAKNNELLTLPDSDTYQIPLLVAFNKDDMPTLLDYLYSVTPLQHQVNRRQAAELVSRSLLTKRFDPAWDLIQRKPSLGLVETLEDGYCPLRDLACMRSAFLSGHKFKFWEKWIYDRIHIDASPTIKRKEKSAPIMDNNGEPIPTHIIDVQKQGEDDQDKQSDRTLSGNHPPADQVTDGYFNKTWRKFKDLFRGPKITHPHRIFGIERIYKMKMVHLRCHEFLTCMSRELEDLDSLSKKQTRFVKTSIFQAVERGHVEFLTQLFRVNSALGRMVDEKDKNVFQYAVECRQAKVLNLMNGFSKDSNVVFLDLTDDDGNNMVHMAGHFTKFAQTNHIRGAALQMQKELQWFERLEAMACPEDLEVSNDTEEKPRELFTRTHIQLVKEGEKSMKETATSCTVVGALIVTMMFAAAFTVPGGNKDDSGNNKAEYGTPILLGERAFRVFIVCDAISLFTSTTSVMLFLGILTSRYAEEDFLKSLPRKMMLGLFTLFLSVSAMMIAFASALFLIFPDETWIAISTTLLASFPIATFMWMQFPFLIEIFNSTYRSKTFLIENEERFEDD